MHSVRYSIFSICVLVLTGLFHWSYAQDLRTHSVHVYFDSDAYELSDEAQQLVRNTILAIQPALIKRIQVQAHTDTDASEVYNQALSERRAQSTSTYLVQQGVPQKILHSEAFGETQQVSDEKARNRRVQLTFFVYEPEEGGEQTRMESKRLARARYVKFTTYSTKTKQVIQSSYVLEHHAGNRYAYTAKDGSCLFNRKYFPNLSLTFAKDGYLNKHVSTTEATNYNVGDTLKIDVYLEPVRVVEKIRYNHIYFYTDTDQFKPEASEDLKALYQFLVLNDTVMVEIQGHMNFSKAERADLYQQIYNNDLSYRRAKAVYHYLIAQGINAERLTYKGMSNKQMVYPIPKSSLEADMNKRVEVWTLERL